jgi:hypothetical protein
LRQLIEADISAVCGPKGNHDAARIAVRHGTDAGSVSLGGRRVSVRRLRAHRDDAGEAPVSAYELFCSTELLGR